MASSSPITDVLESALDTAFTPLPRSIQEESAVKIVEEKEEEVLPPPPASEDLSASTDSWKDEYESQVQSWRAQSAEAREKAEKERLKWETIRKEEAAKRKAAGATNEVLPPWQQSSAGQSSKQLSPEISAPSSRPISGFSTTPSNQDTTTDEKWEDVPSVTSSFPSMSFPEQIDTPPPPHAQTPAQQPPASVTLAIFDSSLSTRTRLTAFVSALAVNLLLPFVNGVMLGFGEIFAKNVVMDWLGWKSSKPGSVATSVGLGNSSRNSRQKQTFHR